MKSQKSSWLNCLAFSFGFAIGLSFVITYLILTDPFSIECPKINNRVCNNRGTCYRGKCDCDAQFSGDKCQYTLCPGFNPFDSTVCNGRGICSPLMTKELLPPPCKTNRPTESNGYLQGNVGWLNSQCKEYTERVQFEISNEILTDPFISGIPTCLCQPAWGGVDCQLTMCPQTSDFVVCGGNGNRSVGLLRNDTFTGTGCQCKNLVSLPSIIRSAPSITYSTKSSPVGDIFNKHFAKFITGFCGRMVWVGPKFDGLVLLQSPNPLDLDYKCFCTEKYFGLACEFGVCPELQGVTCSGHGHPDLGFGLVRNGDKIQSACEVQCASGYQKCNGRCDTAESCLSIVETCPPNRPYRCPNQDCVEGRVQLCDNAYESGSWDDVNTIVASVECSFSSIQSLSSNIDRNIQLKRCFGDSSTLTSVGIVGNGKIQFESRPISLTIVLVGNGSIQFTLDDEQKRLETEGKHTISFQSNTSPKTSWGVNCFVLKDESTPGHVVLSPLIRQYSDPVIVIEYLDTRIEVDVVFSRFVQDINGTHLLALNQDGTVFDILGNSVPIESCTLLSLGCLWLANGTSPDLQSFLCNSNIRNGFIKQVEPCSTLLVNVQKVIPQIIGDVDLIVWNTFTYSPSQRWNVLRRRSDVDQSALFIESSGDIQGVFISYRITSDVIKPCICPPSLNESQLNSIILSQQTRVRISKLGEYGVGTIIDKETGGVRSIRGKVQSIDPVISLMDTQSNLPIVVHTDVLKLSLREFLRGNVECDPNRYPARCKDGACSIISAKFISPLYLSCSCVLALEITSCTCNDGLGNMFTCATNVDPTCASQSNVTLDSICRWRPISAPVPVIGFRKTSGTLYTSLDSNAIPISLTFATCNVTFESGLNYESKCHDPYDLLEIRFIHSLDLYYSTWSINASDPFVEAQWYARRGGIPIFELDHWQTTTHASSNEIDKDYVSTTSLQYWRAEETDHEVYIRHDFDRPIRIITVFIELEFSAFVVGSLIFNTMIYIQTSDKPIPMHDEWITIHRFMDATINGSTMVSFDLIDPQLIHSIRIFAHFPISVRTFIPFADQSCTSGLLIGQPPNYASFLSQYSEFANNSCTCSETCIVNNQSSSGDGICNDYLNISTCLPGTDCLDCGRSPRNNELSNPTLTCPSQAAYDILIRQGGIPSDLWTLREFTSLGFATLEFNFSTMSHGAWTLVKSNCKNECLVYTCPDGSCASSSSSCPIEKYNCPGDGCVRASIRKADFKCACEKGWSGLDCSITECIPGDPLIGSVDPYQWCTCNGPSPLKIKPPFELVWGGAKKTYFSTSDILSLNRPSGRKNSNDVGWVNVFADKAPFGIAFLRKVTRGNETFFTNCPYRKKSNMGLFLELHECVERRSLVFPNEVLEWKVQADGQIIQWSSETQYDDSPYRCPTGACVEFERQCYMAHKINPLCGGGGMCLVDGTCRCGFGKETFIITPELTSHLEVPYAHEFGKTTPARWGIDNDNRYVDEWCRARNCSEVDCSPPRGCFPGSVYLDFKDAQFECRSAPNKGMCANDVHDCARGLVVEPLICSGNGEPRKRDYRDEYYCECGTRVGSEFISNGFGGTRCQDFQCQDDPTRIYYARHPKHTLDSFKDVNGNALPGRWIGPCNGPVGANPDDSLEWARCCNGMTRLETCEMVPCVVGGVTQCVGVDECTGPSRTPKVYICNGKGVLRADGQCHCNRDAVSGMGYTYDFNVYSTKGCYAPITCPISEMYQTVCNKLNPCGDFEYLPELPNIQYIRQQALIFASREGLPLTNRSLVSRIARNNLENVVLQTYVNIALEIEDSIRGIQTDICVYPNDTSSNPFGMYPYVGRESVIGKYRQSLGAPFKLDAQFLNVFYYNDSDPLDYNRSLERRVLYDGLWTTSFFSSSVEAFGVNLKVPFQFNQVILVDIVQFHVYSPNPTQIRFENNQGIWCAPIQIPETSDFIWIEAFCLPTFEAINLILYPGWNTHCSADENSAVCEIWMRDICSQANGVYRPVGTLEYLHGCNEERCCRQITPTKAKIESGWLESDTMIWIDELLFFGHDDEVQPLPSGLKELMEARSGQSNCTDEKVFFDPTFGIGGHLSMFRTTTIKNAYTSGYPPVIQASNECKLFGGVFASSVGDADIGSGYAVALGEACFEGRPLATAGCWVHAQDRTHKSFPKSIDHLIDPRCELNGCFSIEPSRNLAYYSYSHSVSDWAVPRVTHAITWVELFEYIADLKDVLYPVTFSIPTKSLSNNPGFVTPVLNFLLPIYYVQGTAISISVTRPPAVRTITDETASSIWTNNEKCLVRFYTTPNCGDWVAANTASKTFKITPDNYESIFGQNLVGTEMNECDSGNCFHYSDPLVDTIAIFRSVLIHGQCGLNLRTPTASYTNLQSGSGAGMETTLNQLSQGDKFPRLSKTYTEGCYPEIYPSDAPVTVDQEVVHTFTVTNRLSNNGILRPYIDRYDLVQIVPLFAASKIDVYPMLETIDKNTGSHEATLGLEDNPYVCSPIRVERSINLIPEIPNPDYNSSTLLSNTAVHAIRDPNLSFSYFLQIDCQSNSTYICPVNYLPFASCSQDVIPCSDCPQRLRQAFEWSQDFVFGSVFVHEVSSINQDGLNGGLIPIANLYIDFLLAALYDIDPLLPPLYRHPLESISLRGQTNRLSWLNFSDYNVQFETKACLKVIKTANPTYPYTLTPGLCSEELLAVCVRDVYKFTVLIGRQCDSCGDSLRISVIDPGATAFTRFPKANSSLYPFEHLVYDAYHNGTLQLDIANYEDIPWDLVFEQISSSQFIFAFPEARDFLLRGISTRPGFTSPGQVADPNSWVDMNFKRWFPFACGIQINPINGEEFNSCAASSQYCMDSNDEEASLMLESSMPQLLSGIDRNQDLTKVSECGISIDPSMFNQFNNEGPPQPNNGDFRVISSSNPFSLKALKQNTSWTNTGRQVKAPLNVPFTAFGSIKSSIRKGSFRLWIGSLSPVFEKPTVVEYISEWMSIYTTNEIEYQLFYSPRFLKLSVFGFDFSELQIGSIIQLSSVIISNNRTIEECIAKTNLRYVELPTRIISTSPNHQCLYESTSQTIKPGTCSCGDSSPFGGPSCEWPVISSSRGRQICNGYGDDGGLALTSSLQLVPLTSSLGVFKNHLISYICKCIDPGLIVQTVFRPASAFDYAFFIRNDKLPGTPNFIIITDIPEDIQVPVKVTDVFDVCATSSATIASFNTASEFHDLVELNPGQILTDLILDKDEFVWQYRNERFYRIEMETEMLVCHPTMDTRCKALHWNNLLFNTTGGGLLTNGNGRLFESLNSPTSLIPNRALNHIDVEIWLNRVEIGMILRADGRLCDPYPNPIHELMNGYSCPFSAIGTLTLSRSNSIPMQIKEMTAFYIGDTGRVLDLFD